MKKLEEISNRELEKLLSELSILERQNILAGARNAEHKPRVKLKQKRRQFERLISAKQRIYMRTVCSRLNIESIFF